MQSGSGRLRRLLRFRELVFVPPTAHGPKALLHERDELLPRPLRLPHVHVVICEVSVRLEEEREPDVEEPNLVEHQRVSRRVLVQLLDELGGKLAPVDHAVGVVQGVEPVVVRTLVVRMVQHRVGESIVAPGVHRADEGVLRPVAKHQGGGHRQEWDEARPHRERRGAVVPGGVPRRQGQREPGGDLQEEVPSLADQGVERELDPRAHHEADPVADPVEDVVALVRLRRAEILVPLVIVDVVHDDVVEPVRVARDAEHGRVEADVQPVERLPRERAGLEQPAVRAVVHREDEPLEVERVEEREVYAAEDVRGVDEE
mmetsp:Transcript_1940/g.8125  ORF Transcript_1940/g.8125 Transcript_1940/m.8125 type:complete len:316 (+) Transcript_1940:1795-2742(+)